MSKRRTSRAIIDMFVPHTLTMLESPAYMVLSLAARKLLARIEIEHLKHGLQENGNLTITYDQFEDYGIHRHSIGPALRELEELGFIEVTERGRPGNRNSRRPNKYRLTYCTASGAMGNGTHEWRGIATIEQAEETAMMARRDLDVTNISVIRKEQRARNLKRWDRQRGLKGHGLKRMSEIN